MDNRYLQKTGEGDYEYGLRLIELKMVEKPEDLEWQSIVELLKLDVHYDTLRKACQTDFGGYAVYQYFKKKYENSIVENSEASILKEYELKINELQKERKKIQATKIEYYRNLRVDSRFELLYENIKEAIQTTEPPKFEPLYPTINNQEHVAVFSDVHFGAKFISITNKYSREECLVRFNKLLGEMITHIKDNKLSKIKIVNGGDSLQGMLRISDVRMNDIPVVDALVEFSKLMINFLNELSKYCVVEYYHVNSANHMELRLLNSTAGQMAVEDMEKIIVNYIKDALVENERVFVNTEFTQDNLQFSVLNYNIIALHGHQLKDVKDGIKDLSDKYDKKFDFLILGHYHSGVEMVVGEREGYAKEVLVCPSLVGTCPYADSLMVGGKSMVKIHVFEEGKGRRRTENLVLN